jgi:succinate dehydrogenase / fumarate reductase flavoprotein subunit
MGGIPTNVEGEVLRNNTDIVPGLYAAGEVACVSVHGANRLGTNSLLDINVFGKRAGVAAADYANENEYVELPENPAELVEKLIETLRESTGTESVAQIRKELQESMDTNAMVYRTGDTLKAAVADIAALKERYKNVAIQDKGFRYNTDLLEAVELGNLLDLAEVLAVSALAREESRGGHYREDFPTRDDKKFMLHTMAYQEVAADGSTSIRLDYKPVVTTRYQPMERKY